MQGEMKEALFARPQATFACQKKYACIAATDLL